MRELQVKGREKGGGKQREGKGGWERGWEGEGREGGKGRGREEGGAGEKGREEEGWEGSTCKGEVEWLAFRGLVSFAALVEPGV